MGAAGLKLLWGRLWVLDVAGLDKCILVHMLDTLMCVRARAGLDKLLLGQVLDTLIINQLSSVFRGGYVHAVHTSDLYALNDGSPNHASPAAPHSSSATNSSSSALEVCVRE